MEIKFDRCFPEISARLCGVRQEPPGAHAQGVTLEEARENLKEAVVN